LPASLGVGHPIKWDNNRYLHPCSCGWIISAIQLWSFLFVYGRIRVWRRSQERGLFARYLLSLSFPLSVQLCGHRRARVESRGVSLPFSLSPRWWRHWELAGTRRWWEELAVMGGRKCTTSAACGRSRTRMEAPSPLTRRWPLLK